MSDEDGIETAKLDWEANAPRSVFFDDIYFSGDGVSETRHVFLDGNGLPARFAQAHRFVIAELGFGSGLNLLAAWRLWRSIAKPAGAHLDFLSTEKYPLTADAMAQTLTQFTALADLSARLLAVYPPPVAGFHRIALDHDITLTLMIGDAAHMLAQAEAQVDAWFLDGFAPAKNPEMWSDAVFSQIARLSAPNATAATFTVAGAVKRALQGAGFGIEKRPGFGRKREMLTARKTSASTEKPSGDTSRQPWFPRGKAGPDGARVAVIGAGVAGAALARALRQHGCAPTLIDGAGLATSASGNPAGLVMPRLDLGDGAPARFFLAAYIHALRTIDAVQNETGEKFFHAIGVMLKARDEAEAQKQKKLLDARMLPAEFIEPCTDGLYFPKAGVIDPRAYCRALAGDAPLIATNAARAERTGGRWQIRFADDADEMFDAVVFANGRDALRFEQARSIPLGATMGQIDYFPDADAPDRAVAAGPYFAPAPSGGAVIGATYEKIGADDAADCSAAASAANLAAIAEIAPELAVRLQSHSSAPRAAIRCQTPDRAPVAGPLVDWGYYAGAYDGLRTGRAGPYPKGQTIDNAYILTGLGSRGLVTAPLCAEIIAADLAGAPSPVERDIAEALHPARFFIRDLKRARKVRAN